MFGSSNHQKPLTQVANDMQQGGIVISTLNTVRRLTSPYEYCRNSLTTALSELTISTINQSPVQTAIDHFVYRPIAYRITGEALDTMHDTLEPLAEENRKLQTVLLFAKATRCHNNEQRSDGLSYTMRSMRTGERIPLEWVEGNYNYSSWVQFSVQAFNAYSNLQVDGFRLAVNTVFSNTKYYAPTVHQHLTSTMDIDGHLAETVVLPSFKFTQNKLGRFGLKKTMDRCVDLACASVITKVTLGVLGTVVSESTIETISDGLGYVGYACLAGIVAYPVVAIYNQYKMIQNNRRSMDVLRNEMLKDERVIQMLDQCKPYINSFRKHLINFSGLSEENAKVVIDLTIETILTLAFYAVTDVNTSVKEAINRYHQEIIDHLIERIQLTLSALDPAAIDIFNSLLKSSAVQAMIEMMLPQNSEIEEDVADVEEFSDDSSQRDVTGLIANRVGNLSYYVVSSACSGVYKWGSWLFTSDSSQKAVREEPVMESKLQPRKSASCPNFFKRGGSEVNELSVKLRRTNSADWTDSNTQSELFLSK